LSLSYVLDIVTSLNGKSNLTDTINKLDVTIYINISHNKLFRWIILLKF
jgi:hypothetical protein